jgi:hypothetical protein
VDELQKIKVEDATPFLSYKDNDGKEVKYFWIEEALKVLLDKEILFANSRKYLFEGKEQPETLCLFVNCNDVFAWGCADAEEITYHEVEDLFNHYIEKGNWGVVIWCMKKRNLQPQFPVKQDMIKAGVWKKEFEKIGLKNENS